MPKQTVLIVLAGILYILQLAYLAYGMLHGIIFILLATIPGNVAMFIYYLTRQTTAKAKLMLLAAGCLLEGIATLLVAHAGYSPWAGRGFMLALLVVVLLWRDAARQHWQNRGINSDLIWFMLLQAFLTLSTPFVQTVAYLPYTYDIQLYNLDVTLGAAFPVMIAVFFEEHPLIGTLARMAYMTPAAVLVLAYGIERARPGGVPVNILQAFMVASMLALLYFIFPACGPGPAFGVRFPHALPPLGFTDLSASISPTAPRNAMPSLHMLWALLLCVNAWFFYPVFYKWFFAFFALLTALATLGTGEHYFIDLVVAVPFALMVYALVFKGLPLQGARVRAMAGGAVMGGLWIGALVWTSARFDRWWAWSWVALTVMASLFLLNRLICAYKAASAKPVD